MPHFIGGPPIMGIDDEINWRYGGRPMPPQINADLTGNWAWGPPGPFQPRDNPLVHRFEPPATNLLRDDFSIEPRFPALGCSCGPLCCCGRR